MTLTTHVNHLVESLLLPPPAVSGIRRSISTVRSPRSALLFSSESITATVCWPKYLADKLQGSASCREARASSRIGLPSDLMHRVKSLTFAVGVRFKIGLLVFKCLHGLAPRYLSDERPGASIVQLLPAFSPVPGASSHRPANGELRSSWASSTRRPLSGIRSLTICASELSIGNVLGVNWKPSFFPKFDAF